MFWFWATMFYASIAFFLMVVSADRKRERLLDSLGHVLWCVQAEAQANADTPGNSAYKQEIGVHLEEAVARVTAATRR